MSLKFKRNHYLDKLDKLMGLDFSSKTPTITFLNMDWVAKSWVFITTLSTPYILWLLFRLKKYGWLISFLIFVMVPFLVNQIIIEDTNAGLFVWAITAINWVVFLFLLNNTYKDWREPIFENTPGSDFE